MWKYASRRLMLLIPTLLGVVLFTMLLPRLVPGDAVTQIIGTESVMSPERAEEMRRILGIGRPLYVEYWDYITSLLQGDFGRSLRTGAPVFPLVTSRLLNSLLLAFFATFLGIIMGLPVGVLSAQKSNNLSSFFVRVGGIIGLSLPRYWTGTILLMISTFYLRGIFPTVGRISFDAGLLSIFRVTFLPSLTLAITIAAILSRLTRSSMLEVLGRDYIRTARSKGLEERVVFFKHALRNALIPVTTEVGLQFGLALGGMVLVETVFTYPGLGRLVMTSIERRDYAILQGALLMIAFIFIFSNLVVDMSYSFLDPRIRYE